MAQAAAKKAETAAADAKKVVENSPRLKIDEAEKAGEAALKAGKGAEAAEAFTRASEEGMKQLRLAGGGKLLQVGKPLGQEAAFPNLYRLVPPNGFEAAFTNAIRAGNPAKATEAAEAAVKKIMDTPMQEKLARGQFARQLVNDTLEQAEKFAKEGHPDLAKQAIATAKAMVEKMKPFVAGEKTELEAMKWADSMKRTISQYAETGSLIF